MTDTISKISKQTYSLSLGITLLLHFLIFALIQAPGTFSNHFFKGNDQQGVLKIHTLGIKRNNPVNNKVMLDIDKVQTKTAAYKQGLAAGRSKKLSFKDLKAPSEKILPPKNFDQAYRPGSLPPTKTALNGIRFGNEELKKMAQESYSGNSQSFANDKISLKYEVPDGKSLDELNEAELRLYGFLKRGAKNYATSIASQLHDFNLKYPHLQFPMTDTKQLMTGRLTYDEKGNLKQIKMIRWTNIDKLQGFFEEVLKRMDVMQNPPKELWSKNGEFTVFITLQING